MNRSPYPFADFVRAKDCLTNALIELDETYAMLTGETGTGKTALMSELRGQLDRTRHRVLYFAESRKLGAAGLVKVIGENLRVRTSMVHSVSLDRLLTALSEESRTILLWLDEAQDLPTETLAEVRALAESDLDGARRELEQAARFDPRDAVTRYNLGKLYVDLGLDDLDNELDALDDDDD